MRCLYTISNHSHNVEGADALREVKKVPLWRPERTFGTPPVRLQLYSAYSFVILAPPEGIAILLKPKYRSIASFLGSQSIEYRVSLAGVSIAKYRKVSQA